MAQIMYTHVSKCKNDKIREENRIKIKEGQDKVYNLTANMKSMI
jgi:hypothetical protein